MDEDNDNVLGGIIAGIIFLGLIVFSFVGAANTNPYFWDDLTRLCQIALPTLLIVGAPVLIALIIIITAKATATGIRAHANLLKKEEEEIEPVVITTRSKSSKRLPPLKK